LFAGEYGCKNGFPDSSLNVLPTWPHANPLVDNMAIKHT